MTKKYSDDDWTKKNLSHKKLQGLNFQGMNLESFNFEKAYIQSVNFTGANLKGANFKGAIAGLDRGWALAVLSILFFLTALLVICLVIAGQIAGDRMIPKDNYGVYPDMGGEELWMALVIILLVLIFIFNMMKNQLETALKAIFVAGIIIISVRLSSALFQVIYKVPLRTITVSLTSSVQAIVVGFGIGVVAVTIAISISTIKIIGGKIACIIVYFITFFTALLTTVFLYKSGAHIGSSAIGGGLACWGIILGIYIAISAFSKEKKYPLVLNIAIFLAAIGGTNFSDTDLTSADFTEAILKNTDFQGAILTRTCWYHAKQLDLIRSGTTYLQNAKVRQLVVTREIIGEGKDINFDRCDLRGLDLRGAEFKNASFIGADFSQTNLEKANLENARFIDAVFCHANLKDANLSQAILVRTNFEGADLTGANLTASCIDIDGWASSNAKIDGIICDYVFLRWVSNIENAVDKGGDKRDQMPHRGKFEAGGFVTYVNCRRETVQLYHNKDINPRFALNVLEKMSRDYDEPLNIVALGKEGERVFIQVKVSEKILREDFKFKGDYYSRYEEDLKLWSSDKIGLPLPVDALIEKEITKMASEKPDAFIFIDVHAPFEQRIINMSGAGSAYYERLEAHSINLSNHTQQGDTMSDQSRKTEISGGNVHAGPGSFNQGDIVGDINNTINDLPASSNPDQPDIKELLTQLTEAIAQDKDLSKEDKAKALKQMQSLAKAAQNPQDEENKDIAEPAVAMLEKIVAGLPSIAASAKAVTELLPLITKIFGL